MEIEKKNPKIYIMCGKAKHGKDTFSAYLKETYEKNGKKIIVTPGMIELGDKQYEYNMEFGRQIAKVCDEVILVGEEQTKPILDGLKKEKYNEKNIHILNDVKDAFPLMRKLSGKSTYVLLENDLPDIFNE